MSERSFKAIGFAVVLNFAIYWLIAVTYGGDAINGKTINNHFYVGEHGYFTEVSRAFFVYSEFHTLISMSSILAVVIISVRRRKRNSN